jgi:hypothetical protein
MADKKKFPIKILLDIQHEQDYYSNKAWWLLHNPDIPDVQNLFIMQ